MDESIVPQSSSRLRFLVVSLVLLILAGTWLRWPSGLDSELKGFDESVYTRYVTVLEETGVAGFPELCQKYLSVQQGKDAFLPPTRVLFLTLSSTWSMITGIPPLESVRWISALSSILVLIIGAVWIWRSLGPETAVAVTALMICAPTQIHMAHRALIDGFFAGVAILTLWALWETLRNPAQKGWLYLYGAGLAAMVLTKENAFFVYVGICGLLLANLRFKFGPASRALYITTVVAPAIGAILLIASAGGIGTLVQVYRLNIQKSMVLPYALATGDGPWYRYILDLLLVSPIVLLIAVCSLGTWKRTESLKLFFTLFVVLTYAVMCQVKHGMNLRYGNMWDLPLRTLVVGQLFVWGASLPVRYRGLAVALAIALVASLELKQYNDLFVDARIYDPVPVALGKALNLIR